MSWRAIEKVRSWVGKQKGLLIGLVGVVADGTANVIDPDGINPGASIAVKIVGEVVKHGVDRLLTRETDIPEVKAPGQVYTTEQIDQINDWLAKLTGAYAGLLEQMDALTAVSGNETAEQLTALVRQTLDERRELRELFDAHFKETLRQLQALPRIEIVVAATHTAVLDLRAELERLSGLPQEIRRLIETVLQLQGRVGIGAGELRPKDSLSIHSQDERDLVKALLARFRALPAERQRQLPALLNGLGKLQVGSGEFAAAQESFAKVAATVPEAAARAEASYNAYRAALEERNWDVALQAILEAAKHQGSRFAPFPLHRYRPRRILGAGGFGAAFLCHDDHFEEEVVVKTLHGGELERRLKDVFREAQVLRQLAHPSIIRVRDCEYADGVRRTRPYLVMDYFAGVTLEDYVAQHGVLSTADLVVVARGIASAMQAAHGQHILHRDLKPANILVRKVGDTWEVKIIDFGLALRRQTVETSVAAAVQGKTVLSDSAVGTWDYAPPEQMGKLPGVKPGPYSDVFSFGRTCCYARFKTREPRRRHWEELTRELSELLERCIEEGLEHRVPDFGSVLAVLEALDSPGRAETERDVREFAEAMQRAREKVERQQAEEKRERQRVAVLREAGLVKLREMIRRVFDRKNGNISNEDKAILSAHCREHGISEEMTRIVLAEMRKKWDDELPVLEPARAPGDVVTNALGMKLAWLPAKTFWMGERGRQKQVSIPADFYIGVYPVTQGQWQAVMGKNPSYFSRQGSGAAKVKDISKADLLQFPVEQVNCEDIEEFLNKMNERERNNGLLYRLPTGAEWEYSCRGGATSEADCSFDFYLDQPTNDATSAKANFNGDETGNARKGKCLGRTSKVGSYVPNRLGICDMHGNVWEWTADSEGSDRVLRGGSWSFHPVFDCRASDRECLEPSIRLNEHGFRLAAVSSGEQVKRK